MEREEIIKRIDELESKQRQTEEINNQLLRAHGALQQKVMMLEGVLSSQDEDVIQQ